MRKHAEICALLLIAAMAVPAAGFAQGTQGQGGQPAAPPPVQVTTTLLGGNVYGIDGQGGRMAALVGPEGILLVDAQSPAVTDRIVASLKTLSPGPSRTAPPSSFTAI